MSRGDAHRWVHGRRRRSRAIGAASRAGVVLRAAPAQTHTRVTDRVSLHLVDRHLSGMALNELNETAALSRRNLDVGDLTEALEERTELVLGDISRETSNEDGGVVGISELVHGLGSTVETHWRGTHRGVHSRGTRHAHGTGHDAWALVLGGGSGDTHGAVAAVDTLHLTQSTLLVILIGEADKAITTGHSTDGVGHYLGRLARWESALEKGNEDIFVHLRTQVANENGVLGTTVIAARLFSVSFLFPGRRDKRYLPPVSEATTSGPVQLEDTVCVGHGSAVQRQGFSSRGGRRKVNETIAGVAPTTIISIAFKRTVQIRVLTQRTCRGSS